MLEATRVCCVRGLHFGNQRVERAVKLALTRRQHYRPFVVKR